MSCPRCEMPEPADWCWQQRYDCPLGHPPRDVSTRDLLRLIVDLQKRVAKLEHPRCCQGGPQWGHAWNCPTLP